jgi:hypothetical protein
VGSNADDERRADFELLLRHNRPMETSRNVGRDDFVLVMTVVERDEQEEEGNGCAEEKSGFNAG